MTDTIAAPPTSTPSRWRRHRSTLLIVGFLVLAVVVVIALGGGDAGRTEAYDPRNSGEDGAQAVARVLDDEGVEVDVVRSADAFDDADVDAGTTVVVSSVEQLGESTVERLLDHAAGQADQATVVVVDPGPRLLELLDVDGPTLGVDTGDPIAAGCDDPRFADLEIEVDDATSMPGSGCFGDTLVVRDDLVLLGSPQLLTNDQVLRADNAAAALRLLGQSDRLVWYVASYDDLVADDGVDFWSLVPDWIVPGAWLLLVTVVLLALARGRRLGPLATEPLPVVVKAIETTRSRGRLYRKAGDRTHAASALRAAARDRARVRLKVGAHVDEHALVRDVARHVGRSEAEVADLIGSQGRPPTSDRDLIALANALAALEEEVRRA